MSEDWRQCCTTGQRGRKYSSEEGGRLKIILLIEVPCPGIGWFVVLPKTASDIPHTFKISPSTNTLSSISSMANELSFGISGQFFQRLRSPRSARRHPCRPSPFF